MGLDDNKTESLPDAETHREVLHVDTEIHTPDLKQEGHVQVASKKKRKGLSIFLLSGSIAVLLIAYGSVAIYYQSHFFPNTTINGVECGGLKADAVTQLLNNQASALTLEVQGRSEEIGRKTREENGKNEEASLIKLGTVTGADIDFHFTNIKEGVEEILTQQNELLWIQILGSTAYYNSLVTSMTFNESMLEDLVESWDAFQKKNMIAPANAYIGEYSETLREYEIVPETLGNKIDIQKALECIKESVQQNIGVINLEEKECYIIADVTSEDKELLKNLKTANKWVNTNITYDWNGSEIIVDDKLIQEWITFSNDEPTLDEDAVAEFVVQNAKEQDTYGKKRNFLTTLGMEMILPSGAYGWKTDREAETEELIQLIYQGAEIEKEPSYLSKGAWKGQNDIGNSYVEADLGNQHLYLYQEGVLVLETDFVSGKMNVSGCVTPPGVFGLTYKTTDAVLRGEDYETPVHYWMPFNGNVGMHDATWRSSFGGDIYLTNGSHGCINLPLDMAKEIYQYVSTGFPIICYY